MPSARQVDVEQDHVRARRPGIRPALVEKIQRRLAVGHDMQVIAYLGFAEGFTGQFNIAGIVLHQQNFDEVAVDRHNILPLVVRPLVYSSFLQNQLISVLK